MRLHKLPVLKPYQQKGRYGFPKYFQSESTYISPGDYIEAPSGEGEVEEIRYGNNNRRQFRIEGQKRWHDEKHFLNRLAFAGYSWMRMHD